MKVWFDRARAMEADPRVLQASNYPMQPWLDVAEGGWATIVVTDNDRALAEKLADELADLAWSLRDEFQVKEAVPIDEAVRHGRCGEARGCRAQRHRRYGVRRRGRRQQPDPGIDAAPRGSKAARWCR